VYLKDRCGYIKTHLREPMCNLTEQLLNVLKKNKTETANKYKSS